MSEETKSPTNVPCIIPFKSDYKLVPADSGSFTEIIETINTKVKITVRKNSECDIPDFELSALVEQIESGEKQTISERISGSDSNEDRRKEVNNRRQQQQHQGNIDSGNIGDSVQQTATTSGETCHSQILEAIEKSLKKPTKIVTNQLID